MSIDISKIINIYTNQHLTLVEITTAKSRTAVFGKGNNLCDIVFVLIMRLLRTAAEPTSSRGRAMKRNTELANSNLLHERKNILIIRSACWMFGKRTVDTVIERKIQIENTYSLQEKILLKVCAQDAQAVMGSVWAHYVFMCVILFSSQPNHFETGLREIRRVILKCSAELQIPRYQSDSFQSVCILLQIRFSHFISIDAFYISAYEFIFR